MIDTVMNALLVILILAATAFCIFAIIYLKKIAEHVEVFCNDFHKYIEKSNPVLENLEEISRKLKNMVTEVGDYWEEIDDFIIKIRDRFSMISSKTNFLEIESPVKYLVRNVRALNSGISAFWKAYKNK